MRHHGGDRARAHQPDARAAHQAARDRRAAGAVRLSLDDRPGQDALVCSARIRWSVDHRASILLLVHASTDVEDEDLEVHGATAEFGRPFQPRGRPVRLHAEPGHVRFDYTAVVPRPDNPTGPRDGDAPLPGPDTTAFDLLPWTWPSRYCPSDVVAGTAMALFGERPRTRSLLDEVAGWVREHIAYVSGTSDVFTAADETLLTRQGVCRDLAHVTVSFLRALDVPARVTACYALALEPPDFHAVVEAHDGDRWRLLDPTGLAPVATLVPIATGRDAAEVAWAAAGAGVDLHELSVSVAERG